jgi:hypothetical protein
MSNIAQAGPSANNPFLHFWSLGYRRLVPVIPPDAPLSPKSSIKPAARGKAVGIRGQDGFWRGFDWIRYEATEEDCHTWHAMGAGVGIKTGDQGDGTSLVAIDADTLDDRCAAIINGFVRRRFGEVPMRVGRAPRAVYIIRTAGPVPYARIEFGENNDRVELLTDGRQFVAWGEHPVTRQPYHWPVPPAPFSDLPRRRPGGVL